MRIFRRRPFERVDEFYEALDRLIMELRARRYESEAGALHGLLHETAWTTGSELIGEITAALAGMNQEFPDDIRKLRDDCHYFGKHHRRILRLA